MTVPVPTTLLLRATLQDILSELLTLGDTCDCGVAHHAGKCVQCGKLPAWTQSPETRSYHQRELAKHLRLLAHLVEIVRLDFGHGQYPDVAFPDPHEVLRSLS